MYRYVVYLIVLYFSGLGSFASSVLANQNRVITFYVSPQGNDQWAGDLVTPNSNKSDGPLATIQGAQNAIQKLKGQGEDTSPITVQIEQGTYTLAQPISLSSADSGTATNPITYTAYSGSHPVLSGGTTIASPWTPYGTKGIYVTHLPTAVNEQWDFNSLYVNGVRITRARTPAKGTFFNVVPSSTSNTTTSFSFNSGNLNPNWSNLQDIQIVRDARWIQTRFPLASINGNVATVSGTSNEIYGWDYNGNDRYFADNVFEDLAPNTWYLNIHTGDLYYWPPPGENITHDTIIAPHLNQLLTTDGAAANPVHDLIIEGLTFSYTDSLLLPTVNILAGSQADYTIPDLPAVYLSNTNNINFVDNTITHTSGYGYEQTNSDHNIVQRDTISDTGAGGIDIGASKTALNGYNQIVSNTIHDVGQTSSEAVGILMLITGNNTISHNLIYNVPYMGMNIGWTWSNSDYGQDKNNIEYNLVYNVMQEMNDGAGIYINGAQFGTTVNNNLIHDVGSSSCVFYCPGLYLDNGSAGISLTNNIVYRTHTSLLLNGSSPSNTVTNNIFVDNIGDYGALAFTGTTGVSLTKNIIFSGGGITTPLFQNFISNEFTNLDHNLTFSSANQNEWGDEHKNITSAGLGLGDIQADPQFTNYAGNDFSLRPDSPALSLGFIPINLKTLGLVSLSAPILTTTASQSLVENSNPSVLPTLSPAINRLQATQTSELYLIIGLFVCILILIIISIRRSVRSKKQLYTEPQAIINNPE